MKTKFILLIAIVGVTAFYSCKKDFLDRAPLSDITPEDYLVNESQLADYTIRAYLNPAIYVDGNFDLDSQTPDGDPRGTDVEARRAVDLRYAPGLVKVPQSGGDWSFTDVYNCNYFLQTVMPRYKAGKISGNSTNIKHYIGEMYFIRAWAYFAKLQSMGDFPIIKTTLPDNKAILTAASKRAPQTEVARFIISDLDSAILLMQSVSPDGHKNRLSKGCAQLIKSRVALYEATWLKYFKGTAFVPNGPGWPGKAKDYNASYSFPSGSIDGEISYFLTQAMDASKAVADAFPLTPNNMTAETQTSNVDFANASYANPYCKMFSEEDLSSYSEVMLWRDYNLGLGVTNKFSSYIQEAHGWGYTRGFVDSHLMTNGLPIYAPGSGYAGDDSIQLVRKNRDARLWLFLAQPGQINILIQSPLGTHATPVVTYPDILNLSGNHDHPTGYVPRKGNNYDAKEQGSGNNDVGSIVFRASEAYLNYMEACYEKNGTLDGSAQSYWAQLRTRAGIDPDYQKTIAATDLTQEAKNDWGVYSAGIMVDKTLYNIRRERSCELVGEGFRYMDLRRWRAMDQLINIPYHIEGFKLWGPIKNWYKAASLTYSIGDKSTVSAPSLSPYLRVYEKTPTSQVFGGYKWTMAHYLNPIAVQHFLITSENNDISTSTIYQNPGWPTTAGQGPVGF
jgi:hypothetical protein